MAPETFESRAAPRRVKGCSIARRRDTTAIDETRTFGGYPRVESRRREAPGLSPTGHHAHHRIHHRARAWKYLTSTRCALTTPVRVARAPRRTRRPTTASSLQPSAAMSADEVRASHLLVKHQGSRRPRVLARPRRAAHRRRPRRLRSTSSWRTRSRSSPGRSPSRTSPRRCPTARRRSTAATSASSAGERCRRRSRCDPTRESRPRTDPSETTVMEDLLRSPANRLKRSCRRRRFERTRCPCTSPRVLQLVRRAATIRIHRVGDHSLTFAPRLFAGRRLRARGGRDVRGCGLGQRLAHHPSHRVETTRSARVAVVNARELSVNIDDRIRARAQTRA